MTDSVHMIYREIVYRQAVISPKKRGIGASLVHLRMKQRVVREGSAVTHTGSTCGLGSVIDLD